MGNPSASVQTALDELAFTLEKGLQMHRAGSAAVGFIQNHIYRGDGFDPLSPATVAYRGDGRALQDTGNLRESIAYEVTSKNCALVGTACAYARIHNEGGVIRAKKKWLCIPAAGTRKLERRYGKKPRQVMDGLKAEGYTVYFAGRTVCYKKASRGGRPHVAYYLKQQVTIPKRAFFYITEEEAETIAQTALGSLGKN